jgi:hypothetical protein
MTLSTLNTIFAWTAIIAAVLTTISTVGLFWTGSILDKRKQREIGTLQSSLDKLQPRVLTLAQREKLSSELSSYKQMKVGFSAKIFDMEAKQFAEQFSDVFKKAGWHVVEPINAQLLDDFDGKINLVLAATGNAQTDNDLTAIALTISKSIHDAGIPCEMRPIRQGSVGGQFDPGAIYLLIGARPAHGA